MDDCQVRIPVVSPDDGHTVARNMYRKEINILRKTVHRVGFIHKIILGRRVNRTQHSDKITFLGDVIHTYTLKMEATGPTETPIPIYLLHSVIFSQSGNTVTALRASQHTKMKT